MKRIQILVSAVLFFVSINCVFDSVKSSETCEGFQCGSGDCLLLQKLCDGTVDCPDGSDETENQCLNIYCPTFAFKCNYGACILNTMTCNKRDDCVDGSDETPELCGPILNANENPGIKSLKRYKRSVETNCSCSCKNVNADFLPYNSCDVLIPRNSRVYIHYDKSIELNSTQIIIDQTVIEYVCENPYTLIGNSTNVCSSGLMLNRIPQCRNVCEIGSSLENGRIISGTEHRIEYSGGQMVDSGTKIYYECNSKYDLLGQTINTCANGKWERKPPVCSRQIDTTTISLATLSNCTIDSEFQCDSGECKSLDDACDGIIQCADGSDETLTRCSRNYCPRFGFRCSYGACIVKTAKCDKKIDCADGSDETEAVCGIITESSTNAIIPVTQLPSSCYTPTIPENGRIVFVYDNTLELQQGQVIEAGTGIEYKCYTNFVLIGEAHDICYEGSWLGNTPTCKKYCDPIPLHKISILPLCELHGKAINCSQPIPPQTRVSIRCQIGYSKPDRPLPDVILCDASGEWQTHPWKCEEECGVPSSQLSSFIRNSNYTEIRNTPWHAGIYNKYGGDFKYICGGSIISSKLVVSAAHCFWDSMNSKIGDKKNFKVGTGKTFREINATETTVPQIFEVSEIIILENYLHDEGLFYHDIAIVVLSDFIIFNNYILPVCIDFNLRGSDTYISSGQLGTFSGYGTSNGNLRTIDITSIDYRACQSHTNITFRKYITGDKFCAGNFSHPTVCRGESGGGLMSSRFIKGGVEKYYIYGILSVGPNTREECITIGVFTNLNYYINMISTPYIEYSQYI